MPTVQEIDAQIRQLEEQKKQLQERAKNDALGRANAAIEELRAMGYKYRLSEMDDRPVPIPKSGGTGKRRVGVREDVLKVIQANPGISPKGIADKLGWNEEGDKQAIANALGNLKKPKTGSAKIKGERGVYTAI